MNTETTDEQLAHERTKGAKKRPRIIDTMLSAWTPPATTTEAVTNPTDADRGAAYRDTPALISGDISQRVPGDAGVIDAYPDEHPRAAVPFATDELLPVTFDAPPLGKTSPLAPQPAGYSRTYYPGRQPGGTANRPLLVVPADSRPRRVQITFPFTAGGGGIGYLYHGRPLWDGTNVNEADAYVFVCDSFNTPTFDTNTPDELWVSVNGANQRVSVFVEYLPQSGAKSGGCGCGGHG